MNIKEAHALICEHLDYGGSLNANGLAEAIVRIKTTPSAQQEPIGFISTRELKVIQTEDCDRIIVTVWRAQSGDENEPGSICVPLYASIVAP